ncbi:hypothetical protein [Streptomyces sp. NPDC048341]|uniref:hypothetical protein n=1 Tax=Streptomyces sp. NPDC048341 TaxID=3154620 RepID=UPI003417FD30
MAPARKTSGIIPIRLSSIAATLGLLAAMLLGATVFASSAHAQGTYDNALIATDGDSHLGANPAPGGGQCKAFANAMVIAASGGTQSPSGYQTGWSRLGTQVSSADATKGDIIQITPAQSTDATAESLYNYSNPAKRLHTAIILTNNGGDSFKVVDANFTSSNTVGEHTFNPFTWAKGSIVDIWRLGTVPGGGSTTTTTPPDASNTVSLIDGSGAVWSQAGLVTNGSWTQEAPANSALTVSSGGGVRVILSDCNAIWAKEGTPSAGGWTQESDCNTSKSVIVSSTGVQMELDECNAIWAKKDVGPGGWTQETSCGAAAKIAVGGDTQVLVDGCGAVWAYKTTSPIVYGMWTQETGCGAASSIAVGASGTQVWMDGCNAIWAQTGIGYGQEVQEAPCYAGQSVTIGNNDQVILDYCGALWAKNWVGNGGWNQETSCNSAKSVSVGSEANQFLIGLDNSIWARYGVGNTWAQQAPANSAITISEG